MTPSIIGSIVVSVLFVLSMIALIISHYKLKNPPVDRMVIIKPIVDIKKLRPEDQFHFSENLMIELDSTLAVLHATCERLMALAHTRNTEILDMYRLLNITEKIIESSDATEEMIYLLDDIKKFKETYKV